MNKLTSDIEQAITRVMAKITQAAGKQDLTALESLTRKAGELKSMKEQVLAIESRLKTIEQDSDTKLSGPSSSGTRRELFIEISQGMINQNLLTLTDHVNRGRIKIGESMTVETEPNGDKFRTEVLANGNKLQERGAIGKFYREAVVRTGDYVVLSEISPGQWRLRKAAANEIPTSGIVSKYI